MSFLLWNEGRVRVVIWVIIAAFVSAHFGIVLQKNANIFLDTQEYVSLLSKKPFQTRVLMAPVLGWLTDTISIQSLQRFASRIPSYLSSSEAMAYWVIDSVSFFVAVLSFSRLANFLFPKQLGIQRMAVLFFVSSVYFVFCLNPNLSFILPYDVPALAFTSVCLLLFVERRWLLLVPVYTLATLNRETIMFVPVLVFLDWLNNRSDVHKLILFVVLSAIWVLTKIALDHYLPSVPTEQGSRLVYNLVTLAKPWQWPATLAIPALAVICIYNVFTKKPMASWNLTVVIGFAMLFYYAQITEVRAFSDIIPYMAIAIAPVISRFVSETAS